MTIDLPQFHPQMGQASKVYLYRSGEGEILSAIYRFDGGGKKEIRPFDYMTGKWAFPDDCILYNLEALNNKSDDTVIIVEGEKCADALLKLGFTATTSMGGSNAAHKTDWSILQNRTVIIWPDNDEAGEKYAEAVNVTLRNVGAKISTLRYVGKNALCIRNVNVNVNVRENFPKGWDAADAIEGGLDRDDIQSILDQTEFYIESESQNTSIELNQGAPLIEASNDNWPSPDMSFLDQGIEPPKFPLDIFPSNIGKWIKETAESKSAPVDYVAAALLTSSASLIGASRQISPWEGWKETPILWSALVGTPSSGKSPAMDPMLSIMRDLEKGYAEDQSQALRDYEALKLEAEFQKTKWEADVKETCAKGYAPPPMPEKAQEPEMPQAKRLIIRDATVEAIPLALKAQPKGILTYRDELAGWFASFDRYSGAKGGDRAFWLEAFGARSYTVDRIKNGGEPIIIPYLASSILGGIQPDRLESCLLKGDDDGLSARFLYFCPKPVPRQRPRHSADNAYISRVMSSLAGLDFDEWDGDKKPVTITMTNKASDLFERWWQGLLVGEPKGRLAGWWGKLQGIALRVALILHYLEWAELGGDDELLEVSMKHMQAAISLIDGYLAPMAEIAHGLAANSKADQNTVTLAEYIQSEGLTEFTVRELNKKGPMRSLKAPDIKAAVNDLVGFDWLRAAPVRDGEGSGKPQARYIVNPAA